MKATKGCLGAIPAGILYASPALACPVCGANEGAGLSTLAIVAGMIAVPYLVAAVAIKVIRRADAETAAIAAAPTPAGHTAQEPRT